MFGLCFNLQLLSYLCFLCLLGNSGIQHILCCVCCFVCRVLPSVSEFSILDCLFGFQHVHSSVLVHYDKQARVFHCCRCTWWDLDFNQINLVIFFYKLTHISCIQVHSILKIAIQFLNLEYSMYIIRSETHKIKFKRILHLFSI